MVRVRIAPSPTGYLHLGTARAALFNYLFAKHHQGNFILRLEDTDKERSKKEYEDDILAGLKWLGITWDEGPDIGGPFAPYRQSERAKIYRGYIEELLKNDLAYYCYCSEEKLAKEKENLIKSNKPIIYSGTCAHLTEAERKAKSEPQVIRFRTPKKTIEFNDLIRGKQKFDLNLLGDFVIAKDLDNVLYNFACVVDDQLMEISHVVRGEDHLANTPKQVAMAEVLKFNIPNFAHLPLILNADRSKLSKRKNKVSILEYKNEGYLPEAMINFMAFLGWNPKDTREIFSREELIQDFALEKVNKAGAVFDIIRLRYLNSVYIKNMEIGKLTDLCVPYLIKKKLLQSEKDFPRPILETIIAIEQRRIEILSQVGDDIMFLFSKELVFDPKLLFWKKMTTEDVLSALQYSKKILEKFTDQDFVKEKLEKIVIEQIKNDRQNTGQILWPLRVALTGQKFSPSPFEVMGVLGKEKSINRVEKALGLILPR